MMFFLSLKSLVHKWFRTKDYCNVQLGHHRQLYSW